MTSDRISRDDLERRLQGFQDTITGKVEERKQTILTTVAVVGTVVVVVAFLLGRRAGRKRSTFVEIRRL